MPQPEARTSKPPAGVTASTLACGVLCCVLALGACADREPTFETRLRSVGVGGSDDDAGVDDAGADDSGADDGAPLTNRCGDGVTAGDEQCDDGNEIAGDACNPACRLTSQTCGDGIENDPVEECDDGNLLDADACSSGCTRNVCGNGRTDAEEECDDGNDVDHDKCSNKCTENRCRNGRLDPGEQCDDGNRLNDDGCTNACVAVRCGDGVVYPGYEECDDQNDVDDDACSNSCHANVCGNNRIDVHEVCDGNALPDGLNGVCNGECTGATSLEACDPCRRADSQCTDYMGSGINLVDECLILGPEGTGADFADKCAALSACITQSRCDLLDDEIRIGCYCGAGNDLTACQNDTTPASGPCVAEFLAAAGCASQAKPSACVINLAGDISLPVGYAVYLAECDRTFCLDECRPE
jgi:cysteine-rich repeat protein